MPFYIIDSSDCIWWFSSYNNILQIDDFPTYEIKREKHISIFGSSLSSLPSLKMIGFQVRFISKLPGGSHFQVSHVKLCCRVLKLAVKSKQRCTLTGKVEHANMHNMKFQETWKWVFPKIGVPPNGCFFFMENPIKIHDLGGKKPYFWFNTQGMFMKLVFSTTLHIFLKNLPMVLGGGWESNY